MTKYETEWGPNFKACMGDQFNDYWNFMAENILFQIGKYCIVSWLDPFVGYLLSASLKPPPTSCMLPRFLLIKCDLACFLALFTTIVYFKINFMSIPYGQHFHSIFQFFPKDSITKPLWNKIKRPLAVERLPFSPLTSEIITKKPVK